MTDSTQDWADEAAEKAVISAYNDYGYIEDQGDLCDVFEKAAASALRIARAEGEAAGELRGRAMGMREAIQVVDDEPVWQEDSSTGIVNRLLCLLRAAADKLSPPNPGGGET